MINRIKAFTGVLRDSKHPFRFFMGMLLVKTGLSRFFTIQMNGYKIKFSRSSLAVSLFADSKERHEDEDFLKRILKPGQVYVDIGANIGTLVLTASPIVGATGKVIALEAHPVTYKHLEANVVLNHFSNIVLINSAAGDKKGTIYFTNINSDDQNKVLLDQSKGIEVKVDTLDHLFANEPRIDLLKIDVEGYEKFVLLGAASTLKKTEVVYFESWEKHFNGFGYKTSDVLNILRSAGLMIYKAEMNNMKAVSENYQSEFCENLVAVRNPKQFCSSFGFQLVNYY